MNDATADIVRALAQPGERSLKIARVLCDLIVEGGKLGELEERVIRDEGVARTIKVPPALWFTRLRNAVDRGAFERMAERDIVARILLPMEQAA